MLLGVLHCILSRTVPNQCQEWTLQMRTHLSCEAISFDVTSSQSSRHFILGLHAQKSWRLMCIQNSLKFELRLGLPCPQCCSRQLAGAWSMVTAAGHLASSCDFGHHSGALASPRLAGETDCGHLTQCSQHRGEPHHEQCQHDGWAQLGTHETAAGLSRLGRESSGSVMPAVHWERWSIPKLEMLR